MRISDVLTLAGSTDKVIPAIPSLMCASKEIQHGNLQDYQLTALLCMVLVLSCICPEGQLCRPGLLGTSQTTSWEPFGMILCAGRAIH